MAGALEGITVLDLGQVYLGPYCAMLMARLGADVIKVEPPEGESVRLRRTDGETKAFALLNAGKQSIRIDLKKDEGRELVLRLVAKADVVIENFAPGVMDRLGLSYDELANVNPGIVMASATGYGSTGPYSHYKAMDLTVQAMTGILSVTGYPDSPPVKAGPAIADFTGGIHLLAGVLAALFQRTGTGRGQHVEVAMQDAIIPSLTSNLAGYLESGRHSPERTGNRHGGLSVCPYNVYPTSDGWIAILGINERHWTGLCRVMERPELDELPEFATNFARVQNMDKVDEAVGEWTKTRSTAEAQAELQGVGVPCAPVLTLANLFTDEHVRERGVLRKLTTDGVDRWVLGNPIRMSDWPDEDPSLPPRLGQDTERLLSDLLNLSATELGRLRDSEVL
jgi:crotonobetainyl-CoA:carnitine CoA-transferase CaiB-like acyl-CoA transferase